MLLVIEKAPYLGGNYSQLKNREMQEELDYLSKKIEEQEKEVAYYESESRKSESESLRNHWTSCLKVHNGEIEILTNILNFITQHEIK